MSSQDRSSENRSSQVSSGQVTTGNILRPHLFWTKDFLRSQTFFLTHKFCGTKTFFRTKFFWPKILDQNKFWKQNFSDPTFFQTHNVFRPNVNYDGKKIQPTLISDASNALENGVWLWRWPNLFVVYLKFVTTRQNNFLVGVGANFFTFKICHDETK